MIMIDVHWNKSRCGCTHQHAGGTQGNWCLSLSCDVQYTEQNGGALTMHWPWVKLLPREKPKLIIKYTKTLLYLSNYANLRCKALGKAYTLYAWYIVIGTRQTQQILRRYHGLGYIFRKHTVVHLILEPKVQHV